MLTIQLIQFMDKLWRNEGLDLKLKPYGCVSTGDEIGFIEIVLNAETTATLQREAAGFQGAFRVGVLQNFLKEHNPSEHEYGIAIENFVRSCAGYCVATYVLGIGDRHNDNIMITREGHLFHIDFGHFLGNFKKKFGIKRERAPFVFTPDFQYVMGGKDGKDFQKFIVTCQDAYLIVRKHASHIINLFAMMLSTGIPELTKVSDMDYLREALSLDKTDDQAREHFKNLIFESLTTKTTQINNAFHIWYHK